MNKEQQIKEITEVMVSYGLKRLGEFTETELQVFLDGGKVLEKRNYENIISDFATAIYNAGYQKVPDGAVILSPEERDEEMKEINKTLAERDEIKAKIDKLEEQLAEYKKPIDKFIKDREAQAVKVFAERLKKDPRINNQGLEFVALVDIDAELKSLLKEYEK